MLENYKNKCVLITGHTGFKGTWLCEILKIAGADVIGYALEAKKISSFQLSNINQHITSIIGDIRDYEHLHHTIEKYQPEIVIHLAAQPLVRKSYQYPVETYETNIMGTINLLECIRKCDSVKSFLNVTTDKVYENKEWVWGYRETDTLNGFDPYSNSKSCSELVTDSYKSSFLADKNIMVSTVRAGNVIGGGDFSEDRIIPDCVRAASEQKTILIRNPYAVRPFQHVLEALFSYLLIAEEQITYPEIQGSYNVGPDEKDCWQVRQLVDEFCKEWGEGLTWESTIDHGPYESKYLKLDSSKLKSTFNWRPIMSNKEAIKKTVEWFKSYIAGDDITAVMERQIQEFKSIWDAKEIKFLKYR